MSRTAISKSTPLEKAPMYLSLLRKIFDYVGDYLFKPTSWRSDVKNKRFCRKRSKRKWPRYWKLTADIAPSSKNSS